LGVFADQESVFEEATCRVLEKGRNPHNVIRGNAACTTMCLEQRVECLRNHPAHAPDVACGNDPHVEFVPPQLANQFYHLGVEEWGWEACFPGGDLDYALTHRLSARKSLLRGLDDIQRGEPFHDFDGPGITVCQRRRVCRAVSGGSQESFIVSGDIGPGVERDTRTVRQAERRTQRRRNPTSLQCPLFDEDRKGGLTDISADDCVVEIKGDGPPLSRPAANQFGQRSASLVSPSL